MFAGAAFVIMESYYQSSGFHPDLTFIMNTPIGTTNADDHKIEHHIFYYFHRVYILETSWNTHYSTKTNCEKMDLKRILSHLVILSYDHDL